MSSSKNTIKGIVKEVGDIEFIGQNNDFPKQRIIVYKPAFTDEFGQQKGKPDHFAFDILGNNVETLNITEKHVNKKVECEVYFSGSVFNKQDGSFGYAINASLNKITVLGDAPAMAQRGPADISTEGADDDLPF